MLSRITVFNENIENVIGVQVEGRGDKNGLRCLFTSLLQSKAKVCGRVGVGWGRGGWGGGWGVNSNKAPGGIKNKNVRKKVSVQNNRRVNETQVKAHGTNK